MCFYDIKKIVIESFLEDSNVVRTNFNTTTGNGFENSLWIFIMVWELSSHVDLNKSKDLFFEMGFSISIKIPLEISTSAK